MKFKLLFVILVLCTSLGYARFRIRKIDPCYNVK
ncbi:unnamed protein product [Paramecium primaurelia]|uniref:Uncharacterized protein n=1 Tax=Paramecium primaurelia TaxID=5886 RepID=A0A8S1KTU7_PARPR|nr:unnamed protein product [Paramecium primaurelia]